MRLDVLGTGSSGNCYVLHAGGEILLLDAGVPSRRILRTVHPWKSVVGCLVTHEHMDHGIAVPDLCSLGIPLIMSQGTRRSIMAADSKATLGLQGIRTYPSGSVTSVGGFTVLPFATQHDAAEPQGFIIRHDSTGEKLLYATDTYFLKNTFPGIHYWLIECNYIDEVLTSQVINGDLPLELRSRLKQSHMSLMRLKDVFRANDLTTARQIILCHLSDQRSDEARMVSEIAELTGVSTCAARAGQSIDLVLTPF